MRSPQRKHPLEFVLNSRLGKLLSRIGIAPGRSFDSRAVSAETERALERAVPVAHQKILEQLERSPRIVNNWSMIVPPVGTYGTAYRDRACIAFFGLGANVSEDAIYPTAMMDADGRAFESDGRYVLRFSRPQTISRIGLSLRPGHPASARVYVSQDGRTWGPPVVTVEDRTDYALRYATVGRTARYVKVVLPAASGCDAEIGSECSMLNEIELYS